MSVVNQMLRDLDRRNSQAGEGLPQYLRPVATTRGPWPGWRIAAVLLASIALGAGATWLLRPGQPGLAGLLGMAPGEPAVATPATHANQRPDVPQVASLAPGPALIQSDVKPVPALAVPAPASPATIERELPSAAKDVADVTVANFAQAELLVPPVMPSAAEVHGAKPRRDQKVAARQEKPVPSQRRETARKAVENPPPAAAAPRDRESAPVQGTAPDSGKDAAPRATSVDAKSIPAASAKQAVMASVPDTGAAPVAAPDPQAGLRIDKKLRDPSRPAADAEFRQAVALMNKGRIDESMARLRAALDLSPGHQQSRQMLVALLVERRSFEPAQVELEEGLRLAPEQIGFASLLARLLVDRGDSSGALQVLERHAPYASADPAYRSFHAALLQRAARHADAVEEFRAALALNPSVGPWWMGLGISEEALGRRNAAASAFQNARTTGNLSPELVAFVEQRLRQLQ